MNGQLGFIDNKIDKSSFETGSRMYWYPYLCILDRIEFMIQLYPAHAAEALEFNKIARLLKHKCRTDAALERVEELRFPYAH